ncbi:MAG: hypothetical protein AB9872_14235 [Solidesulfovibrio sp.]
MAGGVSDMYLTSLRLAKGESVAEASPAPIARVPGVTTTVASDSVFSQDSAVDNLTAGLAMRFSRFERALGRFSWPSRDSPLLNARLVVKDSDLDGSVSAAVASTGQAVNPYKYFSNGKSSIDASGIEAGDYSFTVVQGPTKNTFNVSVSAKDTWGDVLGKVSGAINASPTLSVNASVVRQQAPFTLDASLASVGSILALAVNPLRREQNVTIADASGDLLSQLGMTAAATNTQPAVASTLQVSVPRRASPTYVHSTGYDANAKTTLAVGLHSFSFAVGTGDQPTSYVSTALDADAATTIAPGTYDFSVAIGGDSRALSVSVKAGWTWGDVLNAVSGQINGEPAAVWAAGKTSTELVGTAGFSLPGVTATTKSVNIPNATGSAPITAGRQLTVSTATGYEGEVLTLTDGSSGILTALGLTTALQGTVVSVAVGDDDTWGEVLRKVSQSVAMATSRVDATSANTSIPAANVPGGILSMPGMTANMTLLNRKLGEALTLMDGATELLATLGMDVTLPGQDGEMVVNGQSMESENNAYSLESGRLLLYAEADVGETLPLTVTRSMEDVESRLGDVVTAYNDVQKYLSANNDFFDSSLNNTLAAPVANNWSGLTSLGFSKTRKGGMLWITSDVFWRALYNDADAADDTMVASPSSLIPGWKTAVADIKTRGAKSFITPETAHLDLVTTRRSSSDLERKNWLVDMFG